jgi:hypothetical protein
MQISVIVIEDYSYLDPRLVYQNNLTYSLYHRENDFDLTEYYDEMWTPVLVYTNMVDLEI